MHPKSNAGCPLKIHHFNNALELTHTSIEDTHFSVLARSDYSRMCESIVTVRMDWTNIGPSGLEFVLLRLPALRKLDVSFCGNLSVAQINQLLEKRRLAGMPALASLTANGVKP